MLKLLLLLNNVVICVVRLHSDDERELLEKFVLREHNFKKLDGPSLDRYVMNVLIPRLGYFERLFPNDSAQIDEENVYFSGYRPTWLDYSLFDMLESHCNLLDYRDESIADMVVLPNSLNCSTLLNVFPKLSSFYDAFRSRAGISAYLSSDQRHKFGPPFW